MPHAIALWGRQGSGKSTTFRLLHGLLLQDGYTSLLLNGPCPPDRDFQDILEKDGRKIGITSSGDSRSILQGGFGVILPPNPNLVLFPTHTSRDTVRYAEELEAIGTLSPLVWVRKTYADGDTNRAAANREDALNLRSRI